MKKIIIILTICLSLSSFISRAQSFGNSSSTKQATSIGIVIYSNDIETIWNALRFANYSKNEEDTVSIFLLGKGVELDSLVKKNADLNEQADKISH